MYRVAVPRLVIHSGEGVGRDHVLSGGECVVGRDADATFTLEDSLVSRRHYRVVYEDGAYWVEDLGSTNGTLVNARRMQRLQLVDGDRIRAGNTEVLFVQKDLLGGAAKPRAVEAPAAKPTSDAAPGRSIDAPVRRRRRRR